MVLRKISAAAGRSINRRWAVDCRFFSMPLAYSREAGRQKNVQSRLRELFHLRLVWLLCVCNGERWRCTGFFERRVGSPALREREREAVWPIKLQ